MIQRTTCADRCGPCFRSVCLFSALAFFGLSILVVSDAEARPAEAIDIKVADKAASDGSTMIEKGYQTNTDAVSSQEVSSAAAEEYQEDVSDNSSPIAESNDILETISASSNANEFQSDDTFADSKASDAESSAQTTPISDHQRALLLIERLGGSTFRERELAQSELVALGTAALPALIDHGLRQQGEILRRVGIILDDFDWSDLALTVVQLGTVPRWFANIVLAFNADGLPDSVAVYLPQVPNLVDGPASSVQYWAADFQDSIGVMSFTRRSGQGGIVLVPNARELRVSATFNFRLRAGQYVFGRTREYPLNMWMRVDPR